MTNKNTQHLAISLANLRSSFSAFSSPNSAMKNNTIKKLSMLALTTVALSACNEGSTSADAAPNATQKPVSELAQPEATTKQANTKAQRLATVEQDVAALLKQLTLEEKISLIHASGKFYVNEIERLGIKRMWLSDGPHGVRYQIKDHSWEPAGLDDDYATYLPPLTTVAASWDRDISALHGDVLGAEARDRGKDFILGPGVNLARLPLYGRNFEYMGEDPILAAKLVVPAVKAIQEHDVAATVKHYALNTQELNRTGVNAKPSERTLREVYLPAFEAAVKEGGTLGIMGAYNEYYGTNANQSKHLVKTILKDDWGFQGVLLTDWNVDINTYDAAMNGLDLEMGTDVAEYKDYFMADPLLKMVQEGKVPESEIDDKVARVLRVQHTIGMMDDNRLPGSRNTDAHQSAARDIAAAGVVLLKNNQVLPLDQKTTKKILVIGPNADKTHGAGGGSSEVKSLYEVTPLQGLKSKLGDKVELTVMRARSSILSPIAADYVASRHWTGTPAWNIAFFSDAERKNKLNESWIVNSQYRSATDNILTEGADQGTKPQFINMSAQIKPIKSGSHTLKLENNGQLELFINGESVLTHQSEALDKTSVEVVLQAGTLYDFEIRYNGDKEFTLGWDAPGNLFSTEQEYIAAAKSADAVIYFGGLSHGDDREAIDRIDMKLPNNQDEIISKLIAANENTIVFITAGSAVEMPWAQQANAIVWGWYGGMEGGNAYADVLFGDVNPSGKMPITLPLKLEDTAPIALNDYNATESLYPEGVFIGYRWFEQQKLPVLFPFGHGLSYSEFSLSNITLSSEQLSQGEELAVNVTVTNTGNRAGAEVVQLYLRDVKSSVERPIKELKNFAKVMLAPKESKTVTLKLNQRDLSFWHEASNDWLAEAGEFEVLLGQSSANISQKAKFTYQP